MIRQNIKRFYILIVAITVPTIILAYLSYNSIQDSLRFTEEHYASGLKNTEETLEDKLNQIESKWIQNNLNYGRFFRSWYFNRSTWRQKDLPQKPSGLNSFMMSVGANLIYPSTQVGEKENFLNLMSMEERHLYLKELTQTIDQQHLKLRLLRMQEIGLSPMDLLLNHLGVIRSFRLLNMKAKALQHIRLMELELSWSNDPLGLSSQLWAEELDLISHDPTPSKVLKLTEKIVQKIETNLGQIDKKQVSIALKVVEYSLSLERLNSEVRQQLYNIFLHLKRFHADLANQHSNNIDLLLNFKMGYPTNKAQTVASNQQLFLFYPLSIASQPIIGIAAFNSQEVYDLFEGSLKKSNSAIKRYNFSLVGKDGLVIENLPNKNTIPYKKLTLNTTSPFKELILYRTPPSLVQDKALERAKMLYFLIIFSFIALFYTAFLIFKTIRKDRALFHMKSNFLSSVTHELKTPLTSIKMFAEMMETGRVKDQSKVQELSSMINKESDRLNILISDILNYNRLEQGESVLEKERLLLETILPDLIKRLSTIASAKNIEINFHSEIGPNNDVNIWADQRAIESLFQNLIENGIKYSPENTAIDVTLRHNQNQICVDVADNGYGIKKTELNKIFNAFYRVGDELTRKTKGSGIGLAIVKRVADLHEATIHLESKVKTAEATTSGTTFTTRFKGMENV